MDERSTTEQPQRQLPWAGLLGGLAGCLCVTVLAAGIVGFSLLSNGRPRIQPASTASATPEPRPTQPVESPSPPAAPRPAWNATNPKPTDPLLFRQVKRSDGAALWVENLTACPITVTLRLAQQNNVSSNPQLPYSITVAGKQKRKVADVGRYDRWRAWSCRYAWNWAEGSLTARHDPDIVYSLPYQPGTRHRLAFAGSKGDYAYAFDAPEDTPVLAARSGVVVLTEGRYSVHGTTTAFNRRVNRVVVRHRDGTLGSYSHLRPGGVVVRPGVAVQPGQLLGYSGNTGFSNSPRLAFCVFRARSGTSLENFPLLFRSQESPAGAHLQLGSSYTAPPAR